MNFEDFLASPSPIKTETWQLGSIIEKAPCPGGIALIFVSELRGYGMGAEPMDFGGIRRQLYKLSKLDFHVPVFDAGDLISGRTYEDSCYVLEEFLVFCHTHQMLPMVIGGSSDLTYFLLRSLAQSEKNMMLARFSSRVSLQDDEKSLSVKNFLTRTVSSQDIGLKALCHLGHQKHLNAPESISLLREVEFETLRLAELMNGTDNAEPLLRHAHVVSFSADVMQSDAVGVSLSPQINGLNRRETMAYFKEMGLGENIRTVGIFDLDLDSGNWQNHQLCAQMVWHFIEGVNIQRSHPKSRLYETYHVLNDLGQWTFHRDTFSSKWYFGQGEDSTQWIPCRYQDYTEAKAGFMPPGLLRRSL